ncbi:tetratricopeptide (TPR) repeat protein [Paraburkholderia sp. GAS199]|uniref:tetratricopeptide repeat protein n=1 Tax=Paraburkholderia sp. GAS199 TaxID=3035126 RepID=UPI003D1C00EF
MSSISTTSPESTAAWYAEAERARSAGHADRARLLFERILGADPTHADALFSCGLLALDSGELEVAQYWISRANECHPSAVFCETLCRIQLRLGVYARAAQTARQGLTLAPDSVTLHYYRALALQVEGKIEDAAPVYRRVLELKPDHAFAHANLGALARNLDALDDAERHLRRAIALAPDQLGARANLATVLLSVGRYEEAWPLFEYRWANFVEANGRPAQGHPQLPLPQWKGEGGANLRTQRLLVTPEQGHGDSLQFVRYLSMATERFAQVGYVCPPALLRLYEDSLSAHLPGLLLLDEASVDARHWDWHCPLMSLPMAFGTRTNTIPASSYLYADAARAASWAARFGVLPEPALPRVGVVWAGGHSGLPEDKVRSMSATQFAPLFTLKQIRWVSLQKTDDPAKRADPAATSCLIDWMDDVKDFADTAALIENLDLVISVDTSVAHLAAAMGKPVWLLNRFAGCWRWLRGRDDSPWYPGMRLFTQTRKGEWSDVLDRIAAALQVRFPAA